MLQPYDAVTYDGRAALFLHYMNSSRSLSRIRFNDTSQRRNVLTMDLEREPAEVDDEDDEERCRYCDAPAGSCRTCQEEDAADRARDD